MMGQRDWPSGESFEAALARACKSDPLDSMLAGSRYHEGIRYCLDLFPRERVHVTLQEDLALDTSSTIQALYRFPQLDDSFEPVVSPKENASGCLR